ncbi:hypothetical protein [Streptomyces sp. YKOK-I1]
MAGTGPQKYPGASLTAWYQDDFDSDLMEVNVTVLHTTEGPTLPSYNGGAVAPNLTAVPDFAAKRLRWYQHFDIDRSSRALVNLSGGVQTNTLNVVQVELVGTCDPATHKKWLAAGTAHIYWPEAPDWALRDVAAFLSWVHANHGVPLTGPESWPAYPSSYGSGGGQRMTFAEWNAFKGVCGHMHVPENVHGDPGAIDFNRLIALAKGTDIEEDPMAGMTAQDIYNAVWKTDAMAAPTDAPDIKTNPTWQAASVLRDIQTRVRANTAAEAAQTAAIAKLAELVGTGVDTATVVAAVQTAIKDAVVKVTVDVTGKEG